MYNAISKKKQVLKFKEHAKEILQLAGPIWLGLIGVQSMELMDTIMLGDVGVTALAASAFVNSIMSVVTTIGLGLTSAIAVLVASAKVKKQYEYCSSVWTVALWFQLSLSVMFLILLELLRQNISIFNQAPQVSEMAQGYFLLMELSILPISVFQICKQFVDGLGFTKVSGIALIISVLLNFLFNWLLIYGHLGLPRLEIVGAGIGTLLARLLLAAGMLIYLKTAKEFQQFKFSFFIAKKTRTIFSSLMGIGLPSALQYLFEIGVFAGSTIMAGWLGEVTLAGHQVALRIGTLTFMVPLSISLATSILVSSKLGGTNPLKAKDLGQHSLYLIALIMVGLGCFLISMRNILPTMFIDHIETVQIASFLLLMAACFQIFDGIQAVCVGCLRGLQDTKIPTLISFFSYWGVCFPLAYGLGIKLNWGIKGIWTGLTAGLVVACITLVLRWKKQSILATMPSQASLALDNQTIGPLNLRHS